METTIEAMANLNLALLGNKSKFDKHYLLLLGHDRCHIAIKRRSNISGIFE
jgi:hypothetical protein